MRIAKFNSAGERVTRILALGQSWTGLDPRRFMFSDWSDGTRCEMVMVDDKLWTMHAQAGVKSQ